VALEQAARAARVAMADVSLIACVAVIGKAVRTRSWNIDGHATHGAREPAHAAFPLVARSASPSHRSCTHAPGR
jgi:hypothetical protein